MSKRKPSLEGLNNLVLHAETMVQAAKEKVEHFKKQRDEKIKEDRLKEAGSTVLYPALHKTLAILSTIAASTNARPALKCIAICKDAIFVTDTYKVVRIKITDKDKQIAAAYPLPHWLKGTDFGPPKYPILIRGDILKEILDKLNEGGMNESYIKILQDNSKTIIITNSNGNEVSHRNDVIKDDYPLKGIKSTFPSDTEKPIAHIVFNLDYLNQVAKAIALNPLIDGRVVQLKIYEQKDKDTVRPFVVSIGGHRIKNSEVNKLGLIMPIKFSS